MRTTATPATPAAFLNRTFPRSRSPATRRISDRAARWVIVGNAGFQMIEGFRRGAVGVMPGPSMFDVYRAIYAESGAEQIHQQLNAMLNQELFDRHYRTLASIFYWPQAEET